MTLIIVDIESDGPAPGLYSMVQLGAIVVDSELKTTYYDEIRPISDQWNPKALSFTGLTRDQTLAFRKPEEVVPEFLAWVKRVHTKGDKPVFVSDNNGYDFGFVNYYLWRFAGENPFGHTSRNMSDLYKVCSTT
jgi:DNA polymerase III alpha subunit (gram-positive type)